MRVPKRTNPIVEEIYWLSRNERFQTSLERLRKDYGIPQSGFKSSKEARKWLKNQNQKDASKFETDFLKLAERCSLYSSKYAPTFLLLFRTLVLSNRLDTWGQRVSYSIPMVEVKKKRDRRLRITITMSPDNTLGQVKKQLDNQANKIKVFQKEILSTLRFKDAPNFVLNAKLWKMKSKGATPEEILEEYKKSLGNEKQRVYKILSTLQKKINAAFR